MSAGIETWEPDPALTAFIDRRLIAEAADELAASEETLRRALDQADKATAAVSAAADEWDQLRKRAAAGEYVSTQEIARCHDAQRHAVVCSGFRADTVSAARAAMEQARVAYATKIAKAHAEMAEAAIGARILAARKGDLATAVYGAPTGGVEGRRIARKPSFDAAMAEAEAQFRAASAALWRAVRAGYRGCQENFSVAWPVSETVVRQMHNRLPANNLRHTMSPVEKLDVVMRLRGEMLEASKLASDVPGVPDRARLLRKKAEQVLDDGDLNRVPALVAELSTARAAFTEMATGGELVAA